MSYRLKLKLTDASQIISPVIVPNNPRHDNNHKSIAKEVHKTGASMVKRLQSVHSYECLKEED